jgi:anti-anti-sigma factor
VPGGNGFHVLRNGTAMFHLTGELDMAGRPVLDEAIGDAVAAGGPILLDLSDVSFMDSTGINAILAAAKRLPSGCIILHGLRGEPQKVLDLTDVGSLPVLHVVPCTAKVAERG